jgi:hypothetical protein
MKNAKFNPLNPYTLDDIRGDLPINRESISVKTYA